MRFRPIAVLAAGAVLAGGPATLVAQGSTAQVPQDTSVQGYAPGAAAAPAAPAPPAAAPAPATAAGGADALKSLGFVEIIPSRSIDRMQQELEQAKLDQREAEEEYATKEQQEGEIRSMVDVKKQEISTLNARRKLAAKSKQEAEKASLEAEKQDAERQKKFLEKRVELHKAEKEWAKAVGSRAEATQKALDIEMELARRRTERAGLADPAEALTSDNVLRELGRTLLQAQRVQADREKAVADKHVDIARRRLELYRAQAAAAGKR